MAEVVQQGARRGVPQPGTAVLRAPRRRPGIRIDMTPMVDVAFLLLIFFMVTTVFRKPLAMEVNVPEAGARVEVPESNVLTVYIDDTEELFTRLPRETPVIDAWDNLRDLFVRNTEANPDLIILVKIHPEAPYETMVDMMDLLEDAGMQRFSLVRLDEQDAEVLEGVR